MFLISSRLKSWICCMLCGAAGGSSLDPENRGGRVKSRPLFTIVSQDSVFMPLWT